MKTITLPAIPTNLLPVPVSAGAETLPVVTEQSTQQLPPEHLVSISLYNAYCHNRWLGITAAQLANMKFPYAGVFERLYGAMGSSC